MKPKLIVFGVFAALFVLIGTGVSRAQNQQPPVILMNGDLWIVDGTILTNVTNDGNICCAELSPDGTKIAYKGGPQIVVQRGSLDVMVLNLTTLEITPIAIQPADGGPDNAILRSGPTWSPDGTRLAWGELHYPSFAPETNRLVIYDFNRGDTQVLVTQLPDSSLAGPSPSTPTWGGSGLAAVSFEYDADWVTSIQVYSDQDGSLLSSTRIPENDAQRFSNYRWVHGSGLDEIAVQYNPAGNWILLNPLTGNLHPAYAVPELYNPLALGSAAMTFTYDLNADHYSWTITYPDGHQVEGQNRWGIHQIALGPDGQTLAQITTDGILTFLRPDGNVTEGPALNDTDFSASLYWGPTAWRIVQLAACGEALPPRLIVGAGGMVRANTTPNNLRDQPATGDIIGELQPGDDFWVIEGPECADGLYWWKVDNYNGTVGWTAEGDSSEYWLEPTLG